MSSDPRTILITGGAGYVGSTLSQHLLASGYRVKVLDALMYGGRPLLDVFSHPSFQLFVGDVRDVTPDHEALAGVDAVVHLAAIVGDMPCQADPDEAVSINVNGTRRMAEAAAAAGIGRFIFASTCSNYGIADTAKPAREDRRLNPVSLYAETKVDGEEMLSAMHGAGDLNPVVLRFATAFGVNARTRFDLLINSFVWEAIRDGKLLVYAGEYWRPYVHVRDMARIIRLAIEADDETVVGSVFNAGSNSENYTKADIVKMICSHLPDTKTVFVAGKHDPRSYRVDFSKLAETFDFSPCATVDEGIREIISAIRSELLAEADFAANSLEKYRG